LGHEAGNVIGHPHSVKEKSVNMLGRRTRVKLPDIQLRNHSGQSMNLGISTGGVPSTRGMQVTRLPYTVAERLDSFMHISHAAKRADN
jgi:hypothetical protein